MPDAIKPLKGRIVDELALHPGLKAAEIARALGCERREVNRCLGYELAGLVQQGSDYRWRLADGGSRQPTAPLAPTTEIARLCRYYLECISQDMDEGASVFARNQYGDPDYAALSAIPFSSNIDWWNSPGVGRLLGKVRADRGKLMLWLGYPVRLRQHRTPRWEGFFVEPVLMWPVTLPDTNGDAPSIDEHMPTVNARILRSLALGDSSHLAGEAARIADELGLGVPADEFPDIDDLVERVARIRPDWDWQETLDPHVCSDSPSIAELSTPGIYNRAVIIPGERSPYTQGLEAELKALGDITPDRLGNTSLGRWLSGDVPETDSTTENGHLIEVLPMNTEQRAAVRAALSAKHTVVTGPPGTGKSQVVTNLLVNAAEAMPKGGILKLHAHNAGKYVSLQVSDTGIGIPKSQQARIFDLFYSTKSSAGFGLWSARRHALTNGGELSVTSEEGKGTTFKLLLPIDDHEAVRKDAAT